MDRSLDLQTDLRPSEVASAEALRACCNTGVSNAGYTPPHPCQLPPTQMRSCIMQVIQSSLVAVIHFHQKHSCTYTVTWRRGEGAGEHESLPGRGTRAVSLSSMTMCESASTACTLLPTPCQKQQSLWFHIHHRTPQGKSSRGRK